LAHDAAAPQHGGDYRRRDAQFMKLDDFVRAWMIGNSRTLNKGEDHRFGDTRL
jgi:hypothetical protein